MVNITLEITNCLDCPNVVQNLDPDPDDSFNMDDMYSACKKLPNDRLDKRDRYEHGRQEYKIITCCARPYQLRKESEVPKWCPYYQ